MNNQDIHVDWSKAPQGTTHVCAYFTSRWREGMPFNDTFWEKWEDGIVYEWNGSWIYFCMVHEAIPYDRIKKPEEKL